MLFSHVIASCSNWFVDNALFVPMYMDRNCSCASDLRTIGCGVSTDILILDELKEGLLSIPEINSPFGSPISLGLPGHRRPITSLACNTHDGLPE